MNKIIGKIIGIEPEQQEDVSDVEKLLNLFKPSRHEPFSCVSEMKYKKYCLGR